MDQEPFADDEQEEQDEGKKGEDARPAGWLPSAALYRGSLVALAGGTLLAVFLFMRPPESESKGEPTRTLATATRAISATATATASPTSGPSPTPVATTRGDSPQRTATPGGERSYTVQQGDTLSGIAQQFGTTVDAITALNPGVTAANLQIGATLRIPAAQ